MDTMQELGALWTETQAYPENWQATQKERACCNLRKISSRYAGDDAKRRVLLDWVVQAFQLARLDRWKMPVFLHCVLDPIELTEAEGQRLVKKVVKGYPANPKARALLLKFLVERSIYVDLKSLSQSKLRSGPHNLAELASGAGEIIEEVFTLCGVDEPTRKQYLSPR